ncbi:MAG TPA: hypothetical protein VH309_09625 [Elusimicrobiota bacterium]|jgi:hypothetical protein|nr:hypothetical protein [Elusimicrobiota bacterium]
MFPRPAAFIALATSVAYAASAASAAALLSAGCGTGVEAANTATPTVIQPFTPDASDAGGSDEIPQGAALAQTVQGSPLCHATYTTCFPDDAINACDFPVDGGSADAGAAADDGAAPACHVVAGAAVPECIPAGLGLTNATCSQSTDCAAGHECIGSGSCRHYCCGGTSACQVNEFCDVQPTAEDPAVVVPVCMPEVPCVLLQDQYDCPATQQCSVVREDGSTSCVNVGTAKDGESCDAQHCARGLVCLGASGSATCAPLCYTAGPDSCATTGRTCVATLPLFRTEAVGVCQ